LLLHERSVEEIAAKLSAAELEQVTKIVGRSSRVYPPGTLDVLKHWRALVSPEPPQRTPGADPRGQPESRTSARSDAGANDRRSVIEGQTRGSPRNAERRQTGANEIAGASSKAKPEVAPGTLSGAKPATSSRQRSNTPGWYRN
jgi:hypothetical protein